MKTYFKFEFKRALFSWRTLAAIIIILICLIVPYYNERKFPHPGTDGINYFMNIGYLTYLPFIAPLIACIPYSNTYIQDKKSGVLNKLFTVVEPKEYFLSRIIVNALVSGLVFLIAQSIMLLFLIICFGIDSNSTKASGAFSTIYYNSKITYIIIVIVRTFISSAAFSTFILGLTTFAENKYFTMIVPLFYVIVTGILFEISAFNRLINFNILLLFHLELRSDLNVFNVIFYCLVLLLIGSLLWYYFGYKKFLNEVPNA